MQTHVKVLGVVYLAVGACMLLAAVFLALTMGSVAGIVGATAEPQDAAIAIPVMTPTTTAQRRRGDISRRGMASAIVPSCMFPSTSFQSECL